MRARSLLYHDVVAPGGYAASGFPGGDADIYKLEAPVFERHLEAVAGAVGEPAADVADWLEGRRADGWTLTFDDGGVGAIERTAPMLEARGWIGHFFVSTDWIGRPGFLDRNQIAELRRRGHVVGSHTCSHPPRMSACSRERLADEWRRSLDILAEIVGEPVTSASVPGGYYSRTVGETAIEAGVRALFTSEPTAAVRRLADGLVFGRFSVQRATPAATAAALAAGRPGPALRQCLFWNAKKAAKAVGGRYWLAARRRLLNR